jgi:hypothetical protein
MRIALAAIRGWRLAWIVYTKGGTQIFPIPFGTFSNAAIVLASASNSPSPPGKPAFARCSQQWRRQDRGHGPSDIKIVWDESVRGDYLYWAGFKTIHIDASFHNELAPVEKTMIDSNVTIFENPGYLRDQRLVGRLLRALKDEGPAFIYVEKYGVHFPYSTKYPPDFHAFPTSEESDASKQQNTIIGSVGAFLRSFLPPARAGQYSDRAIADYPNAIAWSVDEFFRDANATLLTVQFSHAIVSNG